MVVIDSDSNMYAQVASSLPHSRASRGTGVASNGSSVPRSRSPTVVSMARYMPPVSIDSTRKKLSMPSTSRAREAGVDTSMFCSTTGASSRESTPRSARRCVAICWPYCAISVRMRATSRVSLLRELSVYSRSGAGAPDASRVP